MPEKKVLPHAVTCALAEKEVNAAVLSVTMSDGATMPLRVEFLTNHMVRLRANMAGEFGPTLPEQDGFLKTDWPGGTCDVTEAEGTIRLEGKGVTVVFQRDPVGFAFSMGDESVTCLAQPAGLRMGQGACRLAMESPAEEQFLGFGYQGARYVYPYAPDWAPLNHRGRAIQMTGLTSHRSYHAPFFQSSRGYGFFLNTIVQSDWDMAKTDKERYSIALDEERLDLFLIRGPAFRDILERYTELVGRPALPRRNTGTVDIAKLVTTGVPLPSAPAKTPDAEAQVDAIETKARAQAVADPYVGMNVRWFDQKEIEAKARHLRDSHVPCDVFRLDSAWQTIRGSLEWVSQIPDPARMLALLNELHFKPELWQRATIEFGDYPLFKEAEKKGYLVTGLDGKPFRGAMNDEHKVLLDFSNPEAVAWWNAKTAKLVEMGTKVFKLDSESGGYSEALPEARQTRFANGRTGAEMECYAGMLYVKAVYDGMKEALKGERVGLRVYYPTYFAGGRYPYCSIGDRRHRCTQETRIRIALNMGLAGVPFWMGIDYTPFGLPHADQEFNIRLMPYTYSHWRVACETGLPLLRAMVLDYQDDPESFQAGTQFMYGDSFLVAPEIPGSPDAGEVVPPQTEVCGMEAEWEKSKQWRRVYFPAGEWINYWSKEKYRGPEWRFMQVLPDQQPTFVRGGAIIPFGPMMEYAGEKSADPLTLEVYPYGTSCFTLYEDDGKTYGYESGAYAETQIQCTEHEGGVDVEVGPTTGSYDGMQAQRDYVLKLWGTRCPDSVTVDGSALERRDARTDMDAGPSGWCYRKDGAYQRALLVRLPAVQVDKGIKVTLAGGHPVKYYF